MSAKHQDPPYRTNASIVRAQVNRARKHGTEVECWRCGWPIDPEQAFDVGHINSDAGHALSNLAPEHRGENRRNGGKQGAEVQARTKQRASGLLPW